MKKLLIVLFFSLIAVFSCNRSWKDPNTTIPSAKISIATILAAPNVYDGAGVVVKGMVWDIVEDDLIYSVDGYIETLNFYIFKLSDKNGNYIYIYTEDLNNIKEGDIVEVTGIYRRDYISELRKFNNEIESINIVVTKSVNKKYTSTE